MSDRQHIRDVLLIERFGRVPKCGGWARKVMVSAPTLIRLNEMMARYASDRLPEK